MEYKNVYEKIMVAREKFTQANIKKSGRNTFQNFNYFELEDIVPAALKICNELNLYTQVTIADTRAIMNVLDLDNTDTGIVEFSIAIPEFKAESNFNNTIQNVGKMETYYRRYLYLLFLDITEADSIDSAKPKPSKPMNKSKPVNKSKPSKPVNKPVNKTNDKKVLSDKQITDLKNKDKILKKAIENLEFMDPDVTKEMINKELIKLLSEKEISLDEQVRFKKLVTNY